MEAVQAPQQKKSRDYKKQYEKEKQRMLEDPEFRQRKYNATMRRNKERYATDPDYHQKHNDYVNSYNKKCREGYKLYKEIIQEKPI